MGLNIPLISRDGPIPVSVSEISAYPHIFQYRQYRYRQSKKVADMPILRYRRQGQYRHSILVIGTSKSNQRALPAFGPSCDLLNTCSLNSTRRVMGLACTFSARSQLLLVRFWQTRACWKAEKVLFPTVSVSAYRQRSISAYRRIGKNVVSAHPYWFPWPRFGPRTLESGHR